MIKDLLVSSYGRIKSLETECEQAYLRISKMRNVMVRDLVAKGIIIPESDLPRFIDDFVSIDMGVMEPLDMMGTGDEYRISN